MSECASATLDAYGRSGAGLAAFAPTAVAAGAVPALVEEPGAGSVLAVVAAGVGEAGAPPSAEDLIAVAPAFSVAGGAAAGRSGHDQGEERKGASSGRSHGRYPTPLSGASPSRAPGLATFP
jgi:hypothetical protein